MITIAQKLEEKMKQWDKDKVSSVESVINEIIELADEDSLDLLRSRAAEQEVLDILDEA